MSLPLLQNWGMKSNMHRILLPDQAETNDGLHIKAAGFWLKLGEADQELRELEHLDCKTWNSRAAVEVRVAALEVL